MAVVPKIGIIHHNLHHIKKKIFARFRHKKKNVMFYSTVTLLARLRGQSTLQPRLTAMWKDRSCIGMTVRIPCRQSTVRGTSRTLDANDIVSLSPSSQIKIGRPSRAVT